jgi:hypothetical protein
MYLYVKVLYTKNVINENRHFEKNQEIVQKFAIWSMVPNEKTT